MAASSGKEVRDKKKELDTERESEGKTERWKYEVKYVSTIAMNMI